MLLLDVISQGPGCGGQERLFFGFFNPKGDEYLDLGGAAQEQKPVGSFSSLSLPCPWRSEREAKESFPEGEYVYNLLAFLSQMVKALVFKTIPSPSPPPCQAAGDIASVEAGSLLPPPVWTWVIRRESPIFRCYPVVLFLGQHRNFFAHESHINSANNFKRERRIITEIEKYAVPTGNFSGRS